MAPSIKAVVRRVRRTLTDQQRSASQALRAEPDFIIIGAQKGGTTSLYASLINHPQISGASKKEVHFYDRSFAEGMGWYRAHFPLRAALTSSGRITGEATPDYLAYPYVPARIAATLPNVKLIALLRNPVTRAHSHFFMAQRKRGISQSPADALRAELAFLREQPLDRAGYERFMYDWLGKSGINDYPHDDQRQKSSAAINAAPYTYMTLLLRGLYYEQLRRWFEHFPREQFLLLKSEDFFADSAGVIARAVCPFLGIDPQPVPVDRGANFGKSQPLDPALKAELAAFFAPHNAKLYDLLGVDFGW